MKYFKWLLVCLLNIIVFYSCSLKREKKELKVFEDNIIIKQKVDSLLKIMTLEEKIGQLVIYSATFTDSGPVLSDDYIEAIRTGHCGGIFNAYTVKFTEKLQKIAVEKTRLGIPLLIGYDVIHGYKTIFPIPLAESSSWDSELIEKAARISATEATAAGVNWIFAPVADVSREPRWGRISEGSGEDPYLSSCVVKAKVKGLQGKNLNDNNSVLACVKHFAGYGAPVAGREYNTVDMSYKSLTEEYLPPYKAAVDNGVTTVMASFSSLIGMPATCDDFLLTELLKERWGFKGFVVSDWESVKHLVNHGVAINEEDAAQQAFLAGTDIDMESGFYARNLKNLINKGKIPIEKIDESVSKILAMKFRLGLFDNPYIYCNEEREKNEIYTSENLELARDLARKSLVLLKNSNNLLPLDKNAKIAVIGPLADAKRDLLGSWICEGEWNNIPTIFDAFKEQCNSSVLYSKGSDISGEDRSLFKQALNMASMADVILLVIGESADMSGEAASRSNIEVPFIQKELFKEIKKLNKPIVAILLNGRPLVLVDEYEMADAMIEAWFPGSEGARAIVDVVYGSYNPSGKLTVSFPRNIGQIPIYYNYKTTGRPFAIDEKYTTKYLDVDNSPLFPFGYGLSYTTFIPSNLNLNSSIVKITDVLNFTLEVTNTGNFNGEEVVQVYVRDLVGSTTRPVEELKAFKKVFIKKGETISLAFSINPNQLFYLMKNKRWGVEDGEFELLVGSRNSGFLKTSFWIVN